MCPRIKLNKEPMNSDGQLAFGGISRANWPENSLTGNVRGFVRGESSGGDFSRGI